MHASFLRLYLFYIFDEIREPNKLFLFLKIIGSNLYLKLFLPLQLRFQLAQFLQVFIYLLLLFLLLLVFPYTPLCILRIEMVDVSPQMQRQMFEAVGFFFPLFIRFLFLTIFLFTHFAVTDNLQYRQQAIVQHLIQFFEYLRSGKCKYLKDSQSYLFYINKLYYLARSRIFYQCHYALQSLITSAKDIQMEPDNQAIGSPSKKVKPNQESNPSELEQLKHHSLVVADTGDFTMIEKYAPEDSTTNPTLILQAAKNAEFSNMLAEALKFSLDNYNKFVETSSRKRKGNVLTVEWEKLNEDQQRNVIELAFDYVCVSFGCKILQKIKGFVSTEVDAKLSFSTSGMVNRAKRIIALYKQKGVDTNRILIKLATTWEGIKAGQILLKSKIKCNMTLVFHQVQAIAAAQRKLFLISPFVGRILDWYKKNTGKTYGHHEDPGVKSVTQIYNYFKLHAMKTIVMGASFRSIGQVKELAGCDRLTISPKLLEELSTATGKVNVKLDAKKAEQMNIPKINVDEQIFRYEMNSCEMANDLLADGIRKFQKDAEELKSILWKKAEEIHASKKEKNEKSNEENINMDNIKKEEKKEDDKIVGQKKDLGNKGEDNKEKLIQNQQNGVEK